MIIAVDFDGTIVEHEYPRIGKEKPFAFYTLKKLQADGHLLILWTSRQGEALNEAVEFCRKNGIEFYAVNKNSPDETWDENVGRKIVADIYIDDRNLGGFPGWGEAYQMITNTSGYHSNFTIKKTERKKIKLFERLLKLITE
ncbi:MAG: hypothetical protein N2662_01250 [Bacteroidales bacterium]|nr:hypothetical protein [Bacteroidales bacterium]